MSPGSVAVDDFNQDGKPDLIVSNPGQPSSSPPVGSVSLFLGRGNGTFQDAVNFTTGAGNAGFVSVGDFNSDGKSDLAVPNTGTFRSNGPEMPPTYNNDGSVSVLLGKGDGSFQGAVNYGAGAYPVSVVDGDFNADGEPDLIIANKDSGNISILLGKGDGSFQSAVNSPVGPNPTSLVASDFNRDGKQDLLIVNFPSGGGVSVILGNGDGSFQTAANYSAGLNPRSAAVGDFNGDNTADLAFANVSSGDVSVLPGNGDGTFQATVNYGAGTGPGSLAVGDFNADGRPDLVVTKPLTGGIVVILNTCSPRRIEVGVSRGSSGLVISWPLPSVGFSLESATSLSPSDWRPAVEVPATNSGRLEISVPLNQVERYFRLRKP